MPNPSLPGRGGRWPIFSPHPRPCHPHRRARPRAVHARRKRLSNTAFLGWHLLTHLCGVFENVTASARNGRARHPPILPTPGSRALSRDRLRRAPISTHSREVPLSRVRATSQAFTSRSELRRRYRQGTLGRVGVFRGSMARSASARHMARNASAGRMARSASAGQTHGAQRLCRTHRMACSASAGSAAQCPTLDSWRTTHRTCIDIDVQSSCPASQCQERRARACLHRSTTFETFHSPSRDAHATRH